MSKNRPTPKAPQNQPTPVQIPVLRIVEIIQFMPQVVPGENGQRQLQMVQPNGELLLFTLNAEQATALGHALAAPSIEIATPGQVPA